MMILKGFFFIATLAIVFATACNQAAPGPNTTNTTVNNTKPAAPPATQTASPITEIASGSNLYTTHCMTCHKDSGKGGKVTVEGKTLNPDDLTSAKMKAKSDEKLYTYVADGIQDEGMPAFKDKMTPDEIKAVVKHLRDLQK